MAGDSKLDMSLDDLIMKQRKKQKPAAKGKGKPVQGKPQGKSGAQQQKANAVKGKGISQQQQQRKGVQLKTKGGVSKPGAGARPGFTKPVQQQRQGQQRVRPGGPDVRVVPRPGAGPRAGAAARQGAGPRPGPARFRPGGPPQMAGGHFMGGPMMGPMNPMHLQQQMLQQQMMAQQMAEPAPAAQTKWQNDLFDGSVVSSSTSSKLLVSNLDFKVTDEDVKELFGTVGPIRESAINYDKSGRSLGTATVIFERREDALAAFNRYNNVALDNKKMVIEVVETAVPRGTFKTLASGINVSRSSAAATGIKGRGVPHVDYMQE